MNIFQISARKKFKKNLFRMDVSYFLSFRFSETPSISQFLTNEIGALSITFIVLVLLMFMTLGVVSYSVMTVDSRHSINFMQAVQAQYVAEAGIEYGLKKMYEGDSLSSSETVFMEEGKFSLEYTDLDSMVELNSTGIVGDARKIIQVLVQQTPPIENYAIFSTGEIMNVTPLDEYGDTDFSLMIENANSLPNMEDQDLINMAISQGHLETGANFEPAHGYPNFNFYFSGLTPNITYVQGNLHVQGGRTVYGIFVVDGDITLDGSSRVKGVLYMRNPNHTVIHGGGNPSESSVTGGIVANGNVDGTGNHISVHYKHEYMEIFGNYENREASFVLLSWREL
ncbi:MAG: pilus assembly PilX N-terminal domain-containing protein [bacterium]